MLKGTPTGPTVGHLGGFAVCFLKGSTPIWVSEALSASGISDIGHPKVGIPSKLQGENPRIPHQTCHGPLGRVDHGIDPQAPAMSWRLGFHGFGLELTQIG